jgi:hypothetical protein
MGCVYSKRWHTIDYSDNLPKKRRDDYKRRKDLFYNVKTSDLQNIGHGYSKDKQNVFYKGKKIKASVVNFSIDKDGFASDAFNNIYYKGGLVIT